MRSPQNHVNRDVNTPGRPDILPVHVQNCQFIRRALFPANRGQFVAARLQRNAMQRQQRAAALIPAQQPRNNPQENVHNNPFATP